ncbi:HpcH/HpaI aldolase/citrate lyase family protein [Alcaligenaceae bacterium]|nr:HpcH/HpaI aldolase/citrate lyase family protein [Alcaligenaceae bacterium]
MIPSNSLKQALAQNRKQIGLWCSLGSNITAEIVAGSGFDWLLIDVEHSPNDLRSVLVQLQAMAPYPLEPIVRLPNADPILIKQYMDIGARSLLIPSVDSAEEAKNIVAATRYPLGGIRGVSISQRANRYGRVANYHQNAERDICVVVQIESAAAVNAAQAIAEVEGVDALFVGPSDLSTSMGHLIQPGVEEVQAAIVSVHAAARRAGKPVGILAPVEADALRYLEMGYTMVGVGSDQGLLTSAADKLACRYK